MAVELDHERWMRRCLELASLSEGHVSPNPMVGAVLVSRDGHLLGEGRHEVYGGPHAEPNAIADAESKFGPAVLSDATLYVSLEPCSHFGKTPPCADLIIRKRIPRVVVGMVDPFPAVSGSGIERLRAHGIDVTVGVLEHECRRLNEAFIRHVVTGRPLVTLKIAQTLDAQVATTTGDSKWITGLEARRLVHRLRSQLDAVMIGAGTARVDNPVLTVRHVEGRQPLRIVLDHMGTLPPDLLLFNDEWVDKTVVLSDTEGAYADDFRARGGRILFIPQYEGHLDLGAALDVLGRELRLQSVLVEAGPGLSTALLMQDLVDRLFVFIAPRLVGAGTPAIGSLGILQMAEARGFAESAWEQVGSDMLLRGYIREV